MLWHSAYTGGRVLPWLRILPHPHTNQVDGNLDLILVIYVKTFSGSLQLAMCHLISTQSSTNRTWTSWTYLQDMEYKLLQLDLKEKYGGKVPYDMYFPTQQQLVEKRFCSVCGTYFSSVKNLTQYQRKICKKPRKRKTATKNLAPLAKKSAFNKLLPSGKKALDKADGSKQAPRKSTVVIKLAGLRNLKMMIC